MKRCGHLSSGSNPSDATVTKSECTEQLRPCSQGVSRVQLMLPSLALPCEVHVTLTRSHMRLGELAASFHALHTRGTFCTLHPHDVKVSNIELVHAWPVLLTNSARRTALWNLGVHQFHACRCVCSISSSRRLQSVLHVHQQSCPVQPSQPAGCWKDSCLSVWSRREKIRCRTSVCRSFMCMPCSSKTTLDASFFFFRLPKADQQNGTSRPTSGYHK